MKNRTTKSFADIQGGRVVSRTLVEREIETGRRDGLEVKTVTTSSRVSQRFGGATSSSSSSSIGEGGEVRARASGESHRRAGGGSVKLSIGDTDR